MKHKYIRKFIGLSMCFIMALQIMFVPVWASDELTTKTDYNDIIEIVELRDQYTRHFKLVDETCIAVAYPEPVNYLRNGIWEKIDNSLHLVEDELLGLRYQNMSNSYKISFPQVLSEESRISVRKGDYELNWGLSVPGKSINYNIGEVLWDPDDANGAIESDVILEQGNNISRIVYKSFIDSADLVYTVMPEKIKEDIVINRPIDNISFAFDLGVTGLTAKRNEDNSISFFPSAQSADAVFVIQSPYMIDSAEDAARSTDIEMSIIETVTGYTITLIPNSDWLASPDRIYPISIDPTVSSSQIQSDIVDTFVHYGDSAGDHTLADRLVVGTKSGELCRSFVKTLIPSIPAGSYVTDARLNLSITYGTSTMQNIDVYRLNSSWSSYTMTWAIQNSISKTLVKSNVSATAYSNYPSSYRYSCDVTNTIRDIYEGTLTNYGFMVKYSNESIADYNRFYSSDYSTSAVRPVLIVTYNAPVDIYSAYPRNGYITQDTFYSYAFTTGGTSPTVKFIYPKSGTARINETLQYSNGSYSKYITPDQNDYEPAIYSSGFWTSPGGKFTASEMGYTYIEYSSVFVCRGSLIDYTSMDSTFYYTNNVTNSFRGVSTSNSYYNYNCLAYVIDINNTWVWEWGAGNPTQSELEDFMSKSGEYSGRAGTAYSLCAENDYPAVIYYTDYGWGYGNDGHFAKVISWNSNGTPNSIYSKWGAWELIYSSSSDPFISGYGEPYAYFG